MRIADKAVVLQAIRHGDKKYILKLYTQDHGLLTVIVAAGRSPSSRIRPASLFPLTLLDVQVILRQNHDIHRMTDAASYYVHEGLSKSVSKLSIAQFINEVLIKSLKEQQPNLSLFGLIETSLKYLDQKEEGFQNFHLYFMVELARHLGFEPHNNYSSDSPYFDTREGGFSPYSLSFPLGFNKEDSALFSAFLKSDILNSSLNRTQRQTLLEILLAYYQLHLPGFNEMKSVSVLKEVAGG